MRMSRFPWVLPLPLLGALACLEAPGRATLQDVNDAGGDAGDALAETASDDLEVAAPEAADEAQGEVAPDGNDVSSDLRPDGETADDEGDADLAEALAPDDSDAPAPADAAEVGDADADPPAEVVPDTAPDVSSDPGTDGETVAPSSVRCAGRTGSVGVVGANGVWMRGTVGAGARALRIGE